MIGSKISYEDTAAFLSKALPLILFLVMKISQKASEEKQECCPICLENPNDATINSCVHKFCYSCINRWAKKKPNCPICRRRIRKINHGNFVKVIKIRKVRSVLPPRNPLIQNIQRVPIAPPANNISYSLIPTMLVNPYYNTNFYPVFLFPSNFASNQNFNYMPVFNTNPVPFRTE